MTDVLRLIACGIVGYLLGSLNTAIILSKAMGKGDIREQGSKNAGLTNAYRVYGAKFAIITLLGDILKGVLAVLLSWFIAPAIANALGMDPEVFKELGSVIAGVCCVIGHTFPVFFGFRGGKGVLTGLAVMCMITPIPTLMAFALFVALFLIFGYVSLGAISAAAVLPVLVFFRNYYSWQHGGLTITFFMALALAILIIVRHHANIKRLINGTESRMIHKNRDKKKAEQK